MSCNGCRVLRKGCSESCILRPCLQWIDTAEAQAHATLFVAKFFGRAGLMSFISAVPDSQRPALFQSLLYEACGRAVNPVSGAVGLLWTGSWDLCQRAVDIVLRGGALRPVELTDPPPPLATPGESPPELAGRAGPAKRRAADAGGALPGELDLCLRSGLPAAAEKRRSETPSMYSDEGSVTTCGESGGGAGDRWAVGDSEQRLLNLFV